MGIVTYSPWTGEWWETLSLEDLLGDLSDYLLQSGFGSRFLDEWAEMPPDQSLRDLYAAIMEALARQGRISRDEFDRWLDAPESDQDPRISKMLQALVDRLIQEGYLSLRPPDQGLRDDLDVRGYVGGFGPEMDGVRFEITNKGIDFLGFKTLKDLLASLGRSSFGHHDTHHLSTGVEASEASRPYAFGDTLNLDVPGTLLGAIRRQGLRIPLPLEEGDLLVHQSEYTSSCATVLMLDCSHSMILYGEDRFTPAKKVALALAHLIRTQYPGDALSVVLFHDSAEEIPLAHLARVTVGPYHTNTKEGLRLAQRILTRQQKDMRQIVMITDGKPSAITLPNGRIYKNPMGLDPMILRETFVEVANCRRAGILVNTFMLARDFDLVAFVQKVTEIARGKAYFTTPANLGRYLLMDFMSKKTKRIH